MIHVTSKLRQEALGIWLKRLEIVKGLTVLPERSVVHHLLFTKPCPLCVLSCQNCPIQRETSGRDCGNTPYYEIRDGDYNSKEELIALIERMVAIVKGPKE